MFIKRAWANIRRNWPYIIMLGFVLLVSISFIYEEKLRKEKSETAIQGFEPTEEGYFGLEKAKERERALSRLFYENKSLYTAILLTNFAIIIAFCLGLFLDGYIIRRKIRGTFTIDKTFSEGPVKWGISDVIKFIIMFYAFGYVFIIVESAFSRIFPILNNKNFRMIFNTTVLDIAAIGFVLNFVILIHKQKLFSAGLTLKNFLKNVFYGISGYIAAIPPLVLVLTLVYLVVTALNLKPPAQPIVDLLLKEEKVPVLIYSTLFAGVFGPIAEEIFFRGFMYNAAKKRLGIFWSIIITAALFASLHANMAGFAPIFVLGVLLTYLYEKTGSLVPSMVVHIAHNLSMVFLVFLFKMLDRLPIIT